MITSEPDRSNEITNSPSEEIVSHLEKVRSGVKVIEEGRAALFTILDEAKGVKPLSEEALALLDKIRSGAKAGPWGANGVQAGEFFSDVQTNFDDH